MVLIFWFYTFKKYFVSKKNTVICTSAVPVLHVRCCHSKIKVQYKELRNSLYQAKERADLKVLNINNNTQMFRYGKYIRR